MRALIARWLPIAKTLDDDDLVKSLERSAAIDDYTNGDVAGGHAEMLKLWKQHADEVPPHPFEGDVVDRDGKPVIGATVVSATFMTSDSIGILVPIDDEDDHFHLRATTTDATGHFKFADAAEVGAVLAQLGDRRSVPTKIGDKVKLVLEPTRRIAGKVELGTTPNTDTRVGRHRSARQVDGSPSSSRRSRPMARSRSMACPRPRSSSASASSVPTRLNSVAFTSVPASNEPVTGLAINVTSSQRTLDVLARSTIVATARVGADLLAARQGPARDHRRSARARSAGHADPVRASPDRRDRTEGGGAAVSQRRSDRALRDVPAGQLTACAVGVAGGPLRTRC